MGDIDYIFGLEAGTVAGFITCHRTGRHWFNANQCKEPKQLSRTYSNAICHLRAVQRVELKPFKSCTIKVAYAKRAMSKRWDGSQVLCMTHSSLWADLGAIMMDVVSDLSSGSVGLDFVNSTSNPVVIKPGQIVATAIEVDSVEALPDSEPDDDKSIPLPDPNFSCVEREDEILYPCIVSDEAMDAEEKGFDLDMNIIDPPLARPQEILREKATMLKDVHDMYVRASKNLSVTESAKVKELLVELNETTFHDPEKPLTTTSKLEHEIPMTGRPMRIPPHRVAPGRRKIVGDDIQKKEKEGTIIKSSGSWCSPIVLVRKKDGTIHFCVDYHKLNDATHKDAYPLQRIDDILEALRGAKYLCSIALASR